MSPEQLKLFGRSRELGFLRSAYDRHEASVGWVFGPGGVGKTALLRRAAADFHTVFHRAPPLPERQQRQALATALRHAGVGYGTLAADDDQVPSWDALFAALVEGALPGRPTVLVVDDAHRWTESRARFVPALGKALREARASGRAVHVTLVGPELPTSGPELPPETMAAHLEVGPLPFRAAARLLPGATVEERLQAFAVFGGSPRVLAQVDPAASLGVNVRRLLAGPDAPLASAPLDLLERRLQTPTRYAAVLAALAGGEGDWGVVHAGVPGLSASGQVAPYLKRLEELGVVETRRSLDASPRTRSRRYRIRDAFTAFWFRCVLPHRHAPGAPAGDELFAQGVRPVLASLVDAVRPQVWRDFMTHDALERFGVPARECGSLWGQGYDVPVAGVLASGACYYGVCAQADADRAVRALSSLDAQVRETRYGFGRERRLRVLFLDAPPPPPLQREAARRHDTVLVGPEALEGDAG